MARRAKQPKLDTPSARKRLNVRHPAYWNTLTKGGQLGYRRNSATHAGIWYAKFQPPKEICTTQRPERIQITIGTSDDFAPADNLTSFSHEQARQRALVWFPKAAQKVTGSIATIDGYTVENACADHLRSLKARSLYGDRTKSAIDANIAPHLGVCWSRNSLAPVLRPG